MRGDKSVLRFALALLAVIAVGAGFLSWFSARQGDAPQRVVIGGPFQLVDQNGQPFTDKDLKGKYALIYFGYTYCPDVCPTGLQVMTEALDALGPLAEKVRPVFVSVDPKRDTPSVLKDYLSNFHKSFIGLTGTPEQVRRAAQAYRVYFRLNPPDADGNYLVDHAAFIYLMDPQGRYVRHFSHNTPPETMAKELRRFLGASGS